jgi:uncharacterized SAM-binding protein YcdF (DUF218 family)
MPKRQGGRLRWLLLFTILGVVLGSQAGSWLIVDHPKKADLIVVLAGETEQRPARGLQLLSLGFAPRMLLDTPAATQIYRWSQLELAQQYLSGLAQAPALAVCPIPGLSTKEEAGDVARCLAASGVLSQVHSILLVTSEFHTRRALTVFRHEIPNVEFSVAAAYDPAQYGTQWWQHRQWAKTFFNEIVRVLWWYGVDRWHR